MKKFLAIVLAFAMVAALFAACGSENQKEDTKKESEKATEGEANTDPTEPEDPDNPWAGIMDYSDQITITYVAFGDKPNDMDEIQDLINERLVKLINTKIDIQFCSLADWSTKYPLLLQDNTVDLIYAGSWTGYKTNVGKQAFMELDEEFRQKYLPMSSVNYTASAWKQVSINGKCYAVPRNQHDNNNYGAFLIRSDIVEQLGITDKIDSYDELKAFVVKAAAEVDHEQGYAYYNFPSLPVQNPWYQIENHMLTVGNLLWDTTEPIADDASNLEYAYLTDEFREFAIQMADWADKGVWPSSAMQESTHTSDRWSNGQSFIYQNRFTEADNHIQNVEKLGYPVEYNVVADMDAKVRMTDYSGDATAITNFCQNPERAAVVLDILLNDLEINRLCQGGIEGRHYILNDDGTRSLGPESENYGWSGWAWALRNEAIGYPTLALDPRVQAVLEDLNKRVLPEEEWYFDGFATNDDPIRTQLDLVNAIVNNYQYSFELGVYGDETEEKLDQFIAELKEAGIDDIVAEYRKQISEWMAANK